MYVSAKSVDKVPVLKYNNKNNNDNNEFIK